MTSKNKFNLNKLLFQSKENKNSLNQKTNSEIFYPSKNEFFSRSKNLYASNWTLCELSDIKEATTLTIDTMLPQKAHYEFSIVLNIQEKYLGFLRFNILTKTSVEQFIQGVAEFTFTGLKELMFRMYNWMGTTQRIGSRGLYGGYVRLPLSSPHVSLPTKIFDVPPPEGLYDHTIYWTEVSAPHVGTGLSGVTNKEGTMVRQGIPGNYYWITLQQWTQDIIDVWHTDWVDIRFNATEEVRFTVSPIIYFPVPDGVNPEFVLPGGLTDFSNLEFPNQKWVHQQIFTFNQAVNFHGYDTMKNTLETWYSTDKMILKPKEEGSPYYAYEIIEKTKVKSGSQHIIINKLGEDKFRIDISGDLLLISKASTETSWSIPDNPTYKANGNNLFAKAEIYYDIPLQIKQLKTYYK